MSNEVSKNNMQSQASCFVDIEILDFMLGFFSLKLFMINKYFFDLKLCQKYSDNSVVKVIIFKMTVINLNNCSKMQFLR